MKYRKVASAFLFIAIAATLAGAPPAYLSRSRAQTGAVSTSTLEAQRAARALELLRVNQELEATRKQLNSIQGQRSSLQKQLNTIDSSIKQLDLSIRGDELTSANLADEIGELQEELQEIDAIVEDKKSAIAASLQALHQQDTTSFIVLLLGGRSLAEGLAEVQSLGSLRLQLSSDIKSLQQLSDRHIAAVNDLSGKRTQVASHQQNLQNRKVIAAEEKQTRAALLSETRNQESEYQKKVSALAAQQDALDNEIARIEAQLRASLNPNVLPARQEGLLSWPLQSVRITQHFGERSSLYRGKTHNGLDLGAAVGTPVYAAADGVVVAAGDNDRSPTLRYQYGRYVLLKHSNNIDTLYAHLSRQLVFAGQSVKRGQVIGYSGFTGYATGPHLHFGVYYAPSVTLQSLPPAAGLVPVGAVLNPEFYLPTH